MDLSAVNKLEKQVKDEKLSGVERLLLHHKIAQYYMKENNYTLASHHYQQAIKNRYNDESTEKIWLDAHLAIAKLDERFEQYSQARMTLVKLLQYFEKNNRKKTDIAYLYQRLGWLFYKENELHQAHTQLELAKKLLLEEVDLTDPAVLRINDQLAEVYLQLDQPELAIRLQERHFKVNEESWTDEEKATLLIKIGELYFHTDLKKARKNMEDALKHVSKDHPLYVRGTVLTAEIEETLGALPRAAKYYKEALGLVNESFLVVFLHAKLGTIHLKLGRKEQALDYLENGLPLAENYQKLRMQYLYALGQIYSDKQEFDKAFDMYTSFLQGLEADNKTRTIAYANTLQAIAYNYLVQKDIDNALVRYSEALMIYQKSGSNCREEKGLAAVRLAYCYLQTGDADKAEVYYKQGVAILEKVKDKGLKEEALMAIIDFYQKTDQPKKSYVYEDRLVKLQ